MTSLTTDSASQRRCPAWSQIANGRPPKWKHSDSTVSKSRVRRCHTCDEQSLWTIFVSFHVSKDKRPPKTSHAASNTVTQFHWSFIFKVTSNLCRLTLSVRVSVEVNLSRNVRKQGINHVKDNIVLSKENHYFRTFEVTCTGPYSGRKEHLSGGVITKLIPSWHHEGLASWWYFPKVCFCREHRQTAAMNWPSS